MITAQQVIEKLGLQPHVEGGFFKETYRSGETVGFGALPPRYSTDHSLSTAIYYLLTPDTFSAMHKLQSDEVYHFYLGDPVEMLLLWPNGRNERIVLGPHIDQDQWVQRTVPHECWQGSRLIAGGKFALLGCTVAPGFTFEDFEEGRREQLQTAYPHAADMIAALTRK